MILFAEARNFFQLVIVTTHCPRIILSPAMYTCKSLVMTLINNKVSPCTHRASYPDMGGSWVKQVELDEAMQVTTIIS